MTRPEWILLVTSGYAIFLFASHRMRLRRARSKSIPGARFAAFDHRTYLDEAQTLYEAGLPEGLEGAPPPPPTPVRPDLGEPVAWLRPDVWEADAAWGLPEAILQARRHLQAGEDDRVDALIDETQSPAVSGHLASLAIHFFVTRLYAGDLDGAARVLRHLPAWTAPHLSPRLADKHLAQIAWLRAETTGVERDWSAWKHLGAARRLLRAAGATDRFAEPGTRALWAHILLRRYTHALNLEWQLFRVGRALRISAAEHRASAILFYELAYHSALRGRGEEAVDHLARALYYAQGAAFYLRPILEVPEVARMKPSLVQQVRARFRPS